MPPLLNLIATRPQLLAEHAQAYGALLAAELPRAAAACKRQALLMGLALASLLATTLLAGVGLMLWAAMPALAMPSGWLLLVVPLVPALAGIACWMAARAPVERDLLAELQRQVSADLAMLREVAA